MTDTAPVHQPQGWSLVASPQAAIVFGLALLSVAALLVGVGPRPGVLVAAALLCTAAATGTAHLLRRERRMLDPAARQAEAARFQRLMRVWTQSAEIWIRHIEVTRTQADGEVAKLAVLFGKIAGKLDPHGGSHAATGAGLIQARTMAALGATRQDLDRLVAALTAMHAAKQQVVGEVGTQAARLKENAGDIRRIAMQARIVSLNATIEAARAGEAGAPFGVVVADMRQLAIGTAEASDQFSRHTDHLNKMVQAAFGGGDGEDAAIVSMAAAQELVQDVIRRSTVMLDECQQSIHGLQQDRAEIREQVAQVLVALQYQDRASQILSHVASSVQELRADIATGSWAQKREDHWMERLLASYSTAEEHGNHDTDRRTADGQASEVTFF